MKTSTPILISLFFGYISAYGKYRAVLPNAGNIPHPCDRSRLWKAIGHETADGGGARNNFGKDFAAANHTWTKQLCKQDSDGDGKTNGEELGDPDCVWVVGAAAAVTERVNLTHPGVCEPLTAPACASKNLFLVTVCPIAASTDNSSTATNATAPTTVAATTKSLNATTTISVNVTSTKSTISSNNDTTTVPAVKQISKDEKTSAGFQLVAVGSLDVALAVISLAVAFA